MEVKPITATMAPFSAQYEHNLGYLAPVRVDNRIAQVPFRDAPPCDMPHALPLMVSQIGKIEHVPQTAIDTYRRNAERRSRLSGGLGTMTRWDPVPIPHSHASVDMLKHELICLGVQDPLLSQLVAIALVTRAYYEHRGECYGFTLSVLRARPFNRPEMPRPAHVDPYISLTDGCGNKIYHIAVFDEGRLVAWSKCRYT